MGSRVRPKKCSKWFCKNESHWIKNTYFCWSSKLLNLLLKDTKINFIWKWSIKVWNTNVSELFEKRNLQFFLLRFKFICCFFAFSQGLEEHGEARKRWIDEPKNHSKIILACLCRQQHWDAVGRCFSVEPCVVVSSVVDFWKFLTTDLFTKVAQIFDGCLGHFEKRHLF